METQSKVLKWSVIIGIVIVLNLLFNYSLSLLYKQPQFDAFCPTSQVVTIPQDQNSCVSAGGQWTSDPSYQRQPDSKNIATPPMPSGNCNLEYTCGNDFNTAQKNYDKNIFIILVLLGAISVLIGNFLKGNSVISNGLALGGVFSFIIASMRYWGSASDIIHVLILVISFVLLIWVAMKKFKNQASK